MAEEVIQDIGTYVASCQNTVTQYIATRPIMDLCLVAGWHPWVQVLKRWWEQESIDLEGIWEVVGVAGVAEVERDWVWRMGDKTEG